MASPIDRHSFSPRMQLGVLGDPRCALCGRPEDHENHRADEQAKQAALDRYITDVAREIAPKLRDLVGDQQQAAVTIALELARPKVTLRRVDPPYGVDAESFRRAAETLGQEAALVLGEAHRRGVRPIDWMNATYRRERQVVCPRCKRLFNPDRGQCPCGMGTGERIGSTPSSPSINLDGEHHVAGGDCCTVTNHPPAAHKNAGCEGRVHSTGGYNGMLYACEVCDAKNFVPVVAGVKRCPAHLCQLMQACTRNPNCTKQFPPPTLGVDPAHPTTPCIGCNPQRPCFNGWKACEREGEPIGSLMSFEVTSVPVARRAVFGQIAEERIRQDTKWGGPSHDDTHERGEWLDFIREHLERAKKQAGQCPSSAAMDAYRHELVVIAALAVAAIETHDRDAKAPKEKP